MDKRDGLLIIDKPEGLTSHDVVDRVRRALKVKRVGHTGTLDPMATGVLVLLLGKATRLQRFLTGCNKTYRARIRLGFATDTYDRTGKPLLPIVASNEVMLEHIQHVLRDLEGSHEQVPPMFSAKKQAGIRLYKLARRGEEVPRKPVPVRIEELEVVAGEGGRLQRNADGTTDFSLRVRCSAGTYVRSIAHEIGQRLGFGGHLIALRRMAVGELGIDDAVTLEEFERLAQSGEAGRRVVDLTRMPLDLPAMTLSPSEIEKIRRGQAVRRVEMTEGRYCKLTDEQGELIAVGEMLPMEGAVQPRIVLH